MVLDIIIISSIVIPLLKFQLNANGLVTFYRSGGLGMGGYGASSAGTGQKELRVYSNRLC